jgi:hypothetical protein
MTKKHYMLIASILGCYMSASPKTISDISHDLAIQFAKDNPKFNTDKFLKACNALRTCTKCYKDDHLSDLDLCVKCTREWIKS